MSDFGSLGADIRRTYLMGTLLALASATSYGINVVAARSSAQAGVTGADLVSYRAMIFVPLIALALLLMRRAFLPAKAQWSIILRFAITAAATAVCYLTSLQYLPVPIAVSIFYTYPIIVIILTPFFDRVRVPFKRWLICLLALIGVAIAVGAELANIHSAGIAFAVAGSFCCALMFLSASRLEGDSITTFLWTQIIALPVGLVLAYFTGGLSKVTVLQTAGWPVIIVMAGYFIGFLLQILAAPKISAASASLLFLFEPVVSIVVSVLVLNETLTLYQTIGILLVIGALAADLLDDILTRQKTPHLGF